MKEKPVIDIEDLLILLYHHYMLSTDYYAHERERIQQSLIILFITSTSTQPATLVEGGSCYNTNKCLKYKDIKLFKVRNLDYPS